MKKKIVIIGGVAGGATAATRLRRLSEEDEIIVLERGAYVSFANCGLPYYIGGVIKDRERLFEETAETLHAKFNLDVRVRHEALAIDTKAKTIHVRKLETGEEYDETFDKLIISSGASPRKMPFPGMAEADNVFYLRGVDDADAIHDFVTVKKPMTAVVVGGGFIGVELAENLAARGIKVTLAESRGDILPPFDPEIVKLLENEMTRNGVSLKLGHGIGRFENKGRRLVLDSGEIIDNDLVIMSIGIVPDNSLAASAGLRLSDEGYILTSDKMETFEGDAGRVAEDIYAIGDVAALKDYIDGSLTHVALAGLANKEGRLVADVINGLPYVFKGAIGTSIVKVFSLAGASTGHSETYLEKKGLPHKSVIVNRNNHAGYYPDAQPITLKVVFNPSDGRLLGAQAVGAEGADKRIDVIATAIKAHMNVNDLSELELSYAPPFGTAKDIVNIDGYAASNLLEGQFKGIGVADLAKERKDATLIDARTETEFQIRHIEGAVNVPFVEIRSKLTELPNDKNAKIIVYCNVGLTAYMAIRVLVNLGYANIYNLEGGYRIYEASEVPHATDKLAAKEQIPEFKAPNAIEIDATGLQCPGPIMQAAKNIEKLKDGERMRIVASDYGFAPDIARWCENTGNTLLSNVSDGSKYVATVMKGGQPLAKEGMAKGKKTTIVLFSGDMDKALAALIIAQGTRAMGNEAIVFCTFWGLNLLRKGKSPKVRKSAVEKAFGAMMPKGASKMGLSKMNYMGLGASMMKSVMKKKNVLSLEEQLSSASACGVRFIACTMSMDIMGLRKEELIDGIEYAGVASYLAESENAGITLFI
jgi:NADPH-dependent 2,4-dienoyl-CoA reductase/sulfur reductase-like enzyme/peroxiredoxin family protein/rhodanese-related sulfurtransferase/TusA-related sulfurtransferase